MTKKVSKANILICKVVQKKATALINMPPSFYQCFTESILITLYFISLISTFPPGKTIDRIDFTFLRSGLFKTLLPTGITKGKTAFVICLVFTQ